MFGTTSDQSYAPSHVAGIDVAAVRVWYEVQERAAEVGRVAQ